MSFSRLHLSSHNWCTETSRWSHIPRDHRLSGCPCGSIQDEGHMLAQCQSTQNFRDALRNQVIFLNILHSKECADFKLICDVVNMFQWPEIESDLFIANNFVNIMILYTSTCTGARGGHSDYLVEGGITQGCEHGSHGCGRRKEGGHRDWLSAVGTCSNGTIKLISHQIIRIYTVYAFRYKLGMAFRVILVWPWNWSF